MKKRIISGLLAAMMLMGMTSALAATEITAEGTGETTVTLTAEAATFNVTVPTSIPIKVNADGSVTCPTDAEIASTSSAPVKVTKVEMANGAWKLVGYDTADMAAEKVGSNKLAFTITAGPEDGKTTVKTTDMADGTTSQVLGMPGWEIAAKTGKLSLGFEAKASAVATKIETAQTAATVVFTIGWAE